MSQEIMNIFKKRHSYNKGKNNPMYGRFGEKNPSWKGNDVSYKGIHDWLSRNYGQPKKCSECRTVSAKKYEWANISGEYHRDIKDFKRLCSRCHCIFDSNSRPNGENHGMAKLTNKDVIKIRKLYIPKKYNMVRLGKEFNVDTTTIRLIIRRINWKHIKT